MTIRLAIHGLGRIGRLILRAWIEEKRTDVCIAAIQDWGTPQSGLHLLRYDSLHGRLETPACLETDRGQLMFRLGEKKIPWFPHASPISNLWSQLDVDIVLECSGRLTRRDLAAQHLESGAKRVLVSAPTKDADQTIVYGVNHHTLTSAHRIISNASCTTNCLATLAMPLHQELGIIKGHLTTIHAYTGDQCLVDRHHQDMHRARAAAISMCPTSTGTAQAIGLVLPDLAGKLESTAIRVPVANVSLVDLTFLSQQDTTPEHINHIIAQATRGPLGAVLAINEDPLVSCDFNHEKASCIFDTTQTHVAQKNLCRVLAWYDNEWAFANRMLDVAAYLQTLD